MLQHNFTAFFEQSIPVWKRLSYPTCVRIQNWQKNVPIRNQYILHTYSPTPVPTPTWSTVSKKQHFPLRKILIFIWHINFILLQHKFTAFFEQNIPVWKRLSYPTCIGIQYRQKNCTHKESVYSTYIFTHTRTHTHMKYSK